jgi:hypothetical protein
MEIEETNDCGQDNPWKHFSSLPSVKPGSRALAALLYLLASLAISLGFYRPMVALALWATMAVMGFCLVRSLHPLVWLAIAVSAISGFLPALILPMQSVGRFEPVAAAIAAAMCFGLLGGTYLQTTVRNFGGVAILSVLAAGAAWIIGGSWHWALAALALLPAVLLLSVATNMGEYCTTAICYAMGGFLVCALAACLIGVWHLTGSVSVETIRTLLSGWQEKMLEMQFAERDALLASVEAMRLEEGAAQMSAYLDTLTDQINATMGDEVLRLSVRQLLYLIPAALFLACAIPAYLAQRMLNASYAANGLREVVTPEAEFFTMSLPAAVIFALSYLLMLFVPISAELLYLAVSNLCVMLLPGFLAVGWRTLRMRLRGRFNGRMFPLLFLAAFCCLSLNLLFILAAFGACDRIFSAIRRGLIKKSSDENRTDGDDA